MSRQCFARIQEQGWRCFQRPDERSFYRAGGGDRGRERTVGHLARSETAPCVSARLTRRVSAQKATFFRFDSPRFAYIAEDNKAQPYHSPVYVRPGQVVPTITTAEMGITFTPAVPNQRP